MAALWLSPTALHPNSSSPAISSSLRLPRRISIPRPSARRRRGASGASMMDVAAASYATALAQVAVSNGTLEATVSDIENVGSVFSEPGVRAIFINPTISAEKKRDLIKKIAESSGLQPHTVNFLYLLIDKRRTELMLDIVKAFEASYNNITGTEVAVVSSVVPLESQQLAQIAQSVQRFTAAKNVRIKTVIDPSLIAGFTVRYGNTGSKLIDMSVKKQLEEISAQLDFSSITLS